MKKRIVTCPTCGKPVEWIPEQRWRPFCSERCRLIDLGEWATESYRMPSGEEQMSEENEEPKP
ncbi:MAG: DNA gyrase inhibitor YacG [Gammaproteobacteria bacterium]|nr:DNA gyrase inhibitor YacG [Gammaproteobacteria bacterium]